MRKLLGILLIAFIIFGVMTVAWEFRRERDSREFPRRDLLVVLGYKDTRPARFVGDLYESNFIALQLQKMGFVRDHRDDELFYWPRNWWEVKREWTVRLIHSSAGPDDEANRTNPWQKWLSEKAQSEFLEGLKNADAVFYVGHSRLGGGPDFEPPRILQNGHVDYAFYENHRPGLESVRKGLKNSKSSTLKFLGLYSCSSGPHFEKILAEAAPTVRLETTSEAIYYIDSLRLLIDGIKTQLKP